MIVGQPGGFPILPEALKPLADTLRERGTRTGQLQPHSLTYASAVSNHGTGHGA